MGRYIVTLFWSVIYMLIIGFIAAPLSSSSFVPKEAIIMGIVFGILFALIIPTIISHPHKDKSNSK